MPGFDVAPFKGAVWRLVGDQARHATQRIVDNPSEQDILERAIVATLPELPNDCNGMHPLIAAPFRLTTYPIGSRFRRAGQSAGVFYAADQVETAVAELAFYRALFYAEAPGMRLPRAAIAHTAFSVRVATDRAIDLTEPPLNADHAKWTHPSDYAACQDLADRARAQAIGVIRAWSVRSPSPARTAAILTPTAILDRTPHRMQSWHIFVRARLVEAHCEFPRQAHHFALADWRRIDKRIPEMLA